MPELSAAVETARSWISRATSGPGGLLPETVDHRAVDASETRRLLLRPALLGFGGTVAIAVGASLPGSPFTEAGAWFFGIPAAAASSGGGLLLCVVAVYGGMLLLFRTWYGLSRSLARRPGVPLVALAAVFALWILPLLVAPPLFSKDVYSYAAQGEMVSHHISPYQYGPAVLGTDGNSYTQPVDPLWLSAPAPYGPLFLGAAGAITNVTAHHELATVVGLRLLALAGVVLLAWSAPRLAGAYGRDPSLAFVLAVLNPITLLHLIGGAHNDALMIGLLVTGLYLARRGWPLWGIVVCSLAAAVKVPAIIGVVYVGWQWMGGRLTWRDRLRPMVTAALVAAGVLALLSRVTGLGWGWLWALGTPGTVKSLLAPATAVGVFLGGVLHTLGLGHGAAALLRVARAAGLVAAGGIGLHLLRSSERVGAGKALALTMLAFVVLGPVVQPWYLAWGLILLATVAEGRSLVALVWLSIGASFIGLPGARLLLDELGRAQPASMIVALLVLLAIPFTPVATWFRRGVERLRASGAPAG